MPQTMHPELACACPCGEARFRLRAHGFIGIREHGQQPFILAQLTRESACSGPHRSMARAQRSLKMPPKPFPLIVKAKP